MLVKEMSIREARILQPTSLGVAAVPSKKLAKTKRAELCLFALARTEIASAETKILFKTMAVYIIYRRRRILSALTATCDIKIRATNARVRPAEGLYPLVTCAVVLIRFANPKSAPAVIAT